MGLEQRRRRSTGALVPRVGSEEELSPWRVASLGTQGDVWDAQKDMALASLGALVAMTLTALVNRRLQRDFAREWVESLRVKHPEPLGEDEIDRMSR